MLVDVVESLPKLDDAGAAVVSDEAVDRALRSFTAAIDGADSLFQCETPRPAVVGAGLCSGDFALNFRASLEKNRRVHFVLVEKLVELLRQAGSAETLATRISLTPQPSGAVLRIRLEARGSSAEQARLRWGLGLAHVQQALLFTSRYLRQQGSQSVE
jgi:hypothetical protein